MTSLLNIVKTKESKSNKQNMVALNCSHCAVVFRSLTTLHGHIQRHVPDGSYTFDFKSQTGYPNKDPFPFINLSEFRNLKEREVKDNNLKQKKGSNKRVIKKNSLPVKEKESKRTKSTAAISVKHKNLKTTNIYVKNVPEKNQDPRDNDEKKTKTTLPVPVSKIKEEYEIDCKTAHNDDGNLNKNGPVDENKKNHDAFAVESSESIIQKHDIQDSDYNDVDFFGDDDNDVDDIGNFNNDDNDNFGNNNEVSYNETCVEKDEKKNEKDIGSHEENNESKLPLRKNRKRTKIMRNKIGPQEEKNGMKIHVRKRRKRTQLELLKENEIGFEEDKDGKDKHLRKNRKRTQIKSLPKPKEKLKLEDLRFQIKYLGKKKFLVCEICGANKEPYKLVDHIEFDHSDEKLSESLLTKIHELKTIIQNRKTQQGNESDSDSILSEDDEEFRLKKKYRPSTEITYKIQTSRRPNYFVKCRFCSMFILKSKIVKHEKYHDTKAGKGLFRPDNFATCQKCDRKVLKRYIDTHTCFMLDPEEGKLKEEVVISEIKKKRVDPKEKIPCYICGILVKRCYLKSHIRLHSDHRPFTCDICKRGFFSEANLNRHMTESHGDPIFQCDQCLKAFTRKAVLSEHYKMHNNERAFVCTVCGKAFNSKKGLTNHEHLHKAPRFICVHCGKKFRRKSAMLTHITDVHEQVKEWICSWLDCSKTFCSGGVLRRHMLIHTGHKPVSCPHCEASYSQRPELKLHLLRKHNIHEMPPPTNSNPYSGLPHAIIRNPLTQDKDNQTYLKTIFFPSHKNYLFEERVVEHKDSKSLIFFSTPPRKPVIKPTDKTQQLPEPVKVSGETTPQHSQEKKLNLNQSEDSVEKAGNSKSDEHTENTSAVTMASSFLRSETTTTISSEGMFMNSQAKESSFSQSSTEDISRMATSAALQAIRLDEPMESSHMINSHSAGYQQLLSTAEVPFPSILKEEPRPATSQEHSWTLFD